MTLILGSLINVLTVALILRRFRSVELVELHLETREIFSLSFVELLDQLLWRDASLSSVYFYRRAVRVRGAHVNHVLFEQLEESDVNVRLNVFNQVADMDVAVGVR
jgi:hypothetical protein